MDTISHCGGGSAPQSHCTIKLAAESSLASGASVRTSAAAALEGARPDPSHRQHTAPSSRSGTDCTGQPGSSLLPLPPALTRAPRVLLKHDAREVKQPNAHLTSPPVAQPQKDEVAWTYIGYTGESVKGTAVNLTAEAGSIQIRNGSIMVPCDGLYLMSLEGNIHFLVQGLLKLTLMKTDKKPHVLWEQTVEESSSAVSLITVVFFFQHDNITLLTSSEAIISLSFSLVLLSPVDDGVKCHL
ncbi:uncharacterized protein LOC128897554 [Dryobates pubescens]|uniref:uncharacterized protein LOC128897554 n=1 Tax=Dryobates pubescens TaxID=118200 RepID=UPI0023BA2EF7|nr:uncharacterized protein LOC128897554 [Dryobates pubescens]